MGKISVSKEKEKKNQYILMTQFYLKFQCINVLKKSLPHQFEQVRGINWAIKLKIAKNYVFK